MKKLSMKKTTAAAVAAAVGAALLLGGAGTLAYWQDTETSAAQTISSGTLDLGDLAGEAGAWQIKHGAAGDLADFTGKIVPGDILVGTVQVPVELEGQNIEAELVVDTPTVTSTPTNALAPLLVPTVTSVGGDAGASKLFAATDSDVAVVVEISFDTDEQIAQGLMASVTTSYTLTQVAAGTITP